MPMPGPERPGQAPEGDGEGEALVQMMMRVLEGQQSLLLVMLLGVLRLTGGRLAPRRWQSRCHELIERNEQIVQQGLAARGWLQRQLQSPIARVDMAWLALSLRRMDGGAPYARQSSQLMRYFMAVGSATTTNASNVH